MGGELVCVWGGGGLPYLVSTVILHLSYGPWLALGGVRSCKTLSFCILPWVYRHIIPNATPLDGYHMVAGAAKSAVGTCLYKHGRFQCRQCFVRGHPYHRVPVAYDSSDMARPVLACT